MTQVATRDIFLLMTIFAVQCVGYLAIVGLVFSVVILFVSVLSYLVLGIEAIPDDNRLVFRRLFGRTAIWAMVNLLIILPIVGTMFLIQGSSWV